METLHRSVAAILKREDSLTHWTVRRALATAAVLAFSGAATAAAGTSPAVRPDSTSIPVHGGWDGNPIPPDEFEASRLAMEAQVRALVTAGDYAEILRQVEVDSRDGVRLSSGVWRSTTWLTSFQNVLTERAGTEGGWPRCSPPCGIWPAGSPPHGCSTRKRCPRRPGRSAVPVPPATRVPKR
ncbi:hypothetical protein ACQ86G_06500 [Roseateles chitinivorans]|uniref:hypothetical protein n=1 Tax=Roseateles chitinivorans TaxID=2917965 RepID=UPI003D674298